MSGKPGTQRQPGAAPELPYSLPERPPELCVSPLHCVILLSATCESALLLYLPHSCVPTLHNLSAVILM